MEGLETMCMWLHVLISFEFWVKWYPSNGITYGILGNIPEWGQCPNWDCEMHGSLF